MQINKHIIAKKGHKSNQPKIQFLFHSRRMHHFLPILYLRSGMIQLKFNHTSVILSTYISYSHGQLNITSARLVSRGKGLRENLCLKRSEHILVLELGDRKIIHSR